MKLERIATLLSVFGVSKTPKTKEDAVKAYLSADKSAEDALNLCASMFDGAKDYHDVIFSMGLWRKDIFPSAEVKALREKEQSVPDLTFRLYKLEKAIRQKTRRARKETPGKSGNGGAKVRLTPKLCALACLYLSKGKREDERALYIAGVIDGLSFEAKKEDGEKSFFPAWSRMLRDCADVLGEEIMLPEVFRDRYQETSLKAEKGEGLNQFETEILEAFEAVS